MTTEQKQVKSRASLRQYFLEVLKITGRDPKEIRDPSRYVWAWDRVGERFRREK